MPHRSVRPAALVASAFLLFLTTPSLTRAQALLEVIAAGDSSSAGGPTATNLVASSGTFTSTTTRVLSSTTGSTNNGFLDPFTNGSASAASLYTVSGIVNAAPVTLTWAYSGARTWDTENASVQNGISVALNSFDGAFFIYEVGWSLSFVDGPAFMGDFAGNLETGAGIGQGGVTDGFVLQFPSTWTGLGTIYPTLTLPMNNLMSGTYSQSASIALSGTVSATYSVELLSATVPNGSYLTGPAFISFDSGAQIPITAVPEPSTYALLFGGAVLGWVVYRRRR